MNNVKQVFLESGLVKNERQFERYIKLLDFLPKNLTPNVGDGTIEKHHPLPKAIFPELKDAPWNIIVVECRAHYLLHYLLFKAIKHKSCIYSFNQMRRISKSRKILNCRLYASVRKEFAKLVSGANSGRLWTENQKLEASKDRTGTYNYKNPKTGEVRRFKVGEQPIGWKSANLGSRRSNQFKQNVSNRMGGRKHQYNPQTNEQKFDFELCEGFVFGFAPTRYESLINCKNTRWITNIETLQTRRINKNENLPEGFKEGRHSWLK